jgi:hypothetical protein
MAENKTPPLSQAMGKIHFYLNHEENHLQRKDRKKI